jgi:hypothetical protein
MPPTAATARKQAPSSLGDAEFLPLDPAPGTYILDR